MNIESAIEQFIVEEILMGDRGAHISPDEPLIESGILDSLTLLRLISFVEDRFGVTIDDHEVTPDNFRTISDTRSFIEDKLDGNR